jgi:hypothetical protein
MAFSPSPPDLVVAFYGPAASIRTGGDPDYGPVIVDSSTA